MPKANDKTLAHSGDLADGMKISTGKNKGMVNGNYKVNIFIKLSTD